MKNLIFILIVGLFSGCARKGSEGPSDQVVRGIYAESDNIVTYVHQVSTDYSSGAMGSYSPISSSFRSPFSPGVSDAKLFCFGNRLYRLEGLNSQSVNVFQVGRDGSLKNLFQYGFAAKFGPQYLLKLEGLKDRGILLQYEVNRIYLVNLKAKNASDFIISSYDFEDLSTGDEVVRFSSAVEREGRVYIVSQVMDRNWIFFDRTYLISLNLDSFLGANPKVETIQLPLINPYGPAKLKGSKLYIPAAQSLVNDSTDGAGIYLYDFDSEEGSFVVSGEKVDQISFDKDGDLIYSNYLAYNSSEIVSLTKEGRSTIFTGDVSFMDTDFYGNLWVGVRDTEVPLILVFKDGAASSIELSLQPDQISFCRP